MFWTSYVVHTPAASSYEGPGDIVTSGFVAWGGLKAFKASYATGSNPALDLHNDSTGNFDSTINILSDGSLDVDAATAAAGRGATKIGKLYDQTGNAKHWVQNTNGDRPVLALTGGPNNSYTIVCNSVGMLPMASGTTITAAQPFFYTAVVVADVGITGNQMIMGKKEAAPANYLSYRSGDGFALAAGGAEITVAGTEGTWYHVVAMGSGASSSLWVDTTNQTGNAGSTGYSAEALDWGGNSDAIFFDGKISEAGIWTGDVTSSQADLNTNAHSRWSF